MFKRFLSTKKTNRPTGGDTKVIPKTTQPTSKKRAHDKKRTHNERSKEYALQCNITTAIETNKPERVRELLKLIEKQHIDYWTLSGWTFLNIAAGKGCTEICEILVDFGAGLNSLSKFGSSSLHYAAFEGHSRTCQYLCDAGADPTILDKKGKLAVDVVSVGEKLATKEVLEGAASAWRTKDTSQTGRKDKIHTKSLPSINDRFVTDDSESVSDKKSDATKKNMAEKKPRIIAKEANLKKKHSGLNKKRTHNERSKEYALQCNITTAIETNKPERVRELLKLVEKQHIDYLTLSGWTFLNIAAGKGCTEICEILVDFGAGLNSLSKFGSSSLHYAAFEGHSRTCQYLCDAGADPTILDKKGKLAVDVVSVGEKLATKEVLEGAARAWRTKDTSQTGRKDKIHTSSGSESDSGSDSPKKEGKSKKVERAESPAAAKKNEPVTAKKRTSASKPATKVKSDRKQFPEPVMKSRERKGKVGTQVPIKFKCHYNHKIYVLKSSFSTLLDLSIRVKEKLCLDDKLVDLFIEDSDGDRIFLAGDEDLEEEIEAILAGLKQSISVFVEATETGRQEAAVASTASVEQNKEYACLATDFDLDELGHRMGGQHRVVMATRKLNGEKVALKIHTVEKDFEHERDMLTKMRSPAVVKLIDVKIYPPENLYVLVLERCRETLGDILEQCHSGLSREDAQSTAVKICGCVSYLRQMGVVHGDLKPKNFGLIGDSFVTNRAVLLDFDGACVQYVNTLPSEVSLSYVAPERLMSSELLLSDPAVDLWSLGVTLYQLLSGKLLGIGMVECEVRKMLLSEEDDYLNAIGLPLNAIEQDSARRLIARLLQKDPNKRELKGAYVTGHQDTVVGSLVTDVKKVRKGVQHLQQS